MRRVLPGVAGLAVLGLLAGCGGTSTGTAAPKPTHTSAPVSSAAPVTRTKVAASFAGRLPFAISREALVQQTATQALLAGGMLPDDTSSAKVIAVDLATGHARTQAGSLAVPVHDAAGGPWGARPAVYGGGNASEQSIVQALGPHGWRVVGHLPTTRSDLSVVTSGADTWVIGGYDGAGEPTDLLRSSGGRPAQARGRLVNGVRYAATAVVGGSAYVFGGEVAGAELGSVQRIDLRTGHTTVIGRLPHPLGHAEATVVGNRILLVGGCVGVDRRTAVMWWYDPATGRFTHAGRLPVPLSDASLVGAGATRWLIGGQAGQGQGGVTDRVIELRVQ